MTMFASVMERRRGVYAALVIIAIDLGLFVHRHPAELGRQVSDAVGDALWAAMIVWIISLIAPTASRRFRFGVAYAICAVVETSQALHGTTLDALRANRFAQLVLGSGFDPRDFVWYAIGVVIAVLIDRWIITRPTSS